MTAFTARRIVAVVGGALLGLLTIFKIIDMGLVATVARPFDPVLEWTLVEDAYDFVHASFGAERGVGEPAAPQLGLAMSPVWRVAVWGYRCSEG